MQAENSAWLCAFVPLPAKRHLPNGNYYSAKDNPMNQSPKISIPQFNSIAEEAAFWDGHDTAEFEDEFEEIDVEFEMPLLQRGLVIMLDEPYLSQLKTLADQQHQQVTNLAKEWLIERLEIANV
jgi:hypothetical protein